MPRTALLSFLGAFLFLSPQIALADSYTERQMAMIVAKAMEVIRGDYLFYDASKDADCRKEIERMLKMKIAREQGKASLEGLKENTCLDKHSEIMTPRERREMDIHTSGSVVGIGAAIRVSPGPLSVEEVIKGSPAESAGILSGDILLRARNEDDTSFFEFKELQSSLEKIRGAKGSNIYLVIERNGAVIELPPFKRDVVEVPSVSVKEFEDVGYLSVKHFSERTGDELEAAVIGFFTKGIGRLVLDLRDNPGGLVTSALKSLYYWNSRLSDVMVTVRYKNGEKVGSVRDPTGQCPDLENLCLTFVDPKTQTPKGPGGFGGFKVVILINKGSASASEIFAGVMKDWVDIQNKVLLVGGRTLGKGVGQTTSVLPNAFGFSLRRTTFEYLVGNAKVEVNKIGVFPHYLIDDTRETAEDTLTERDQQWRRALAIVREMR